VRELPGSKVIDRRIETGPARVDDRTVLVETKSSLVASRPLLAPARG
jgi:hypothetical protein